MPKIEGDYKKISVEMVDLYKNHDLSLAKIGERFNVSREAVRRRLAEEGVKMRSKNTRHKTTFNRTLTEYENTQRQILFDLYHKFNMSFSQISFYTGINPKTVHTIIKSNPDHISRQNPPKIKEPQSIIMGYSKLGLTPVDLARKFNKPVSEILEILGDLEPGKEIDIKNLSSSA